MAAEALGQPSRRGRALARACAAAVAALAVAIGAAGERSTAVTRVVTAGFGSLTTVDFGIAAAAAAALAAACWLLLWRSLARFPADVLRADSARAGRALLAAEYLNVLAACLDRRGQPLARPAARLPAVAQAPAGAGRRLGGLAPPWPQAVDAGHRGGDRRAARRWRARRSPAGTGPA